MAQPKTSTPAPAWGNKNPSSSPSSSPWGANKTTCSTTTSFSDVMNEEYAKQLEEDDVKEEEEEYLALCKETEQVSLTTAAVEGYEVWEEDETISSEQSGNETDNDLLLAKLLQMEFDKENDQHIRSLEKNYNGSDKVSVSFKNYYSHQHFAPHEPEDDGDLYYESSDDTEDDYGGEEERKPTTKPKYGSEVITKHDSLMTERKNTRKMEQFSSDFNSGDVDSKIRIPNHVFNKLKMYSEREQNRDVRLTEKQDHSTHERALDEHTRLILYKMVNNGTLDSLEGIIAMGKESVIIYAKVTPPEQPDEVVEYAIKVYKTTLSEFKTREKYIKEDYRFKDRFQKQNPRKIIKLWAEKEFRNLQRMEEAGISCPKAVLLRKHVLLLSFVGTDGAPAPKLKDAHLNKHQLAHAYTEVITEMKKMYEVCNLIHADMSEYNVLWHQGRCVFIDVSQSVEPAHAQAFHFLYRDCKNMSQFFTKAGVADVMKEDELFRHVCGRDLAKISLDELENESKENFEGNEELLSHGIDSKNFAFDYHFRQSQLANKEKTTEEEETFLGEEE